MSVRIMGQIWGLALSRAEKWILMSMADHADHEGENCHPGVGLTAWKTDYDERTVERTIAGLISAGILSVSSTTPDGRRIYTIDLTNAPKKAKYSGRRKRRAGGGVVPPPMERHLAGGGGGVVSGEGGGISDTMGAAFCRPGGGILPRAYKEEPSVESSEENRPPRAREAGAPDDEDREVFLSEEDGEEEELVVEDSEKLPIFAAAAEFMTGPRNDRSWTDAERATEFTRYMRDFCEKTARGDVAAELRLLRIATTLYPAMRKAS